MRVYNLRELSGSRARKFKTLAKDIIKNHAEIDTYKNPADLWAVKYYEREGKTLFKNALEMGRYYARASSSVDAELIDNISVMTFNTGHRGSMPETVRDYEKYRKQSYSKRVEEKKIAEQKVKEKSAQITGKKKRRVSSAINDVLQALQQTNDELVKMRRENEKLMRKIAKLEKATVKKATAKKATAKKATAKKATVKKAIVKKASKKK